MDASLSLEQKAALVAGGGFWSTLEAPEAGIRSVVLTDGPHGVRRQVGGDDHLGIGESAPATCFPPAAGIASSWNADLVERVGRALGEEARAQGVGVLLGPGVNIKRSPLCGRNFEYFSEDPYLSGVMGVEVTKALQSHDVIAMAKHYVVNDQEYERFRTNVEATSTCFASSI